MSNLSLSRSHNNNLTEVQIGDIRIWFSYETPVAFSIGWATPVVSENVWSNTTGRHLASIDGGGKPAAKTRVPFSTFELMLKQLNVTASEALV